MLDTHAGHADTSAACCMHCGAPGYGAASGDGGEIGGAHEKAVNAPLPLIGRPSLDLQTSLLILYFSIIDIQLKERNTYLHMVWDIVTHS